MTAGRCAWCDEVVDVSRMGLHIKKHLDMTITPNTAKAKAKAGAKAKAKAKAGAKGAAGADDSQKEAMPAPAPPNRDAYVLKIVDYANPNYWMFVRAHTRATLSDLDDVLREVWACCCPDHESHFWIRGSIYEDTEDEDGDEGRGEREREEADNFLSLLMAAAQRRPSTRPLDVYLRGVVRHKDKIWYYFGEDDNETELEIVVYATASSSNMDAPIGMLARNEQAVVECSSCKAEDASKVCGECIGKRNPLYCNGCLHEHPCGDGRALPIENTPRVGMCPYEGLSDKERKAKKRKNARIPTPAATRLLTRLILPAPWE